MTDHEGDPDDKAKPSEEVVAPAIDSDEAEPVEPEEIPEAAKASAVAAPHHHPPPPPSLRARDRSGIGPPFDLRETPKLVRDVMSRKLFTVEPDTILKDLERHMQTFRIGHLPVVDGEKLVGLVTHNDLLHASSSFLSDQADQRNALIHTVPVSRIMQRELITVGPDDSLTDVARIIWEARVGCVLVVENENKLIGIVTEGDFLRIAHHFLKGAG